MASLRTATPQRAAFAECQAEGAHALFAKLARARRHGFDSVPRCDGSRVNIASTCFRAATQRSASYLRSVGTGVALRRVEMLLSELTIIYLAAAAPFGVARFVEEHERGSRAARSIMKSAAASLAWPAVVIRLLKRIASLRNAGAGVDESRAPEGQSVERVRRATVNALRAVEDLIASERVRDCEAQRQALFAARESVERYAGLALACASAREEAQPEARELELCRIAGRDGDDLLVAGKCLHRRNVTRLRAHRERARSELVHALAAAGEAAHNLYPSRPQFHSPQRASETAKLISEALLQMLSRAVELLSLFDEREAVVAVARLLDAECARLRRDGSTPADAARDGAGEGEKSCTTRAAHTAFATPSLPTTTSTGG